MGYFLFAKGEGNEKNIYGISGSFVFGNYGLW